MKVMCIIGVTTGLDQTALADLLGLEHHSIFWKRSRASDRLKAIPTSRPVQ